MVASMLFPDSNDGVTMEFTYNMYRNEQEFLDPLRITFPCRVGRVDLLSCNSGGSHVYDDASQ